MGVYESEWLRPATARPDGERKFRLLAVTALALLSRVPRSRPLAGAPRQTSSLVFNVAVLPVPFVAWWTYAARSGWRCGRCGCSAPGRRRSGSSARSSGTGSSSPTAASCPSRPGWWDIAFAGAQLLLIARDRRGHALVRSRPPRGARRVRDQLRRHRARSSFVGRGLEKDVSLATLIPLNRPLLGIVTLMLVAAAALGSWDGIPRSLVLLGLGEVGLTIGNLALQLRGLPGRLRQRPLGESRLGGRRRAVNPRREHDPPRNRPAAPPTGSPPRPRAPAGLTVNAPCHPRRDRSDARRRHLRADRRPPERRTHRHRYERRNRRRDGMPRSRFTPDRRAVVGTSRQRARRVRAHQGRAPPR